VESLRRRCTRRYLAVSWFCSIGSTVVFPHRQQDADTKPAALQWVHPSHVDARTPRRVADGPGRSCRMAQQIISAASNGLGCLGLRSFVDGEHCWSSPYPERDGNEARNLGQTARCTSVGHHPLFPSTALGCRAARGARARGNPRRPNWSAPEGRHQADRLVCLRPSENPGGAPAPAHPADPAAPAPGGAPAPGDCARPTAAWSSRRPGRIRNEEPSPATTPQAPAPSNARLRRPQRSLRAPFRFRRFSRGRGSPERPRRALAQGARVAEETPQGRCTSWLQYEATRCFRKTSWPATRSRPAAGDLRNHHRRPT